MKLAGGKGWPARKADSLTAICEPQPLTTLWASTACCRDSTYANTQSVMRAGVSVATSESV
jgi:hypothetical protein